jgi:hypothetical protein
MRHASKYGIGILAVLAGWIAASSINGQQPAGSQSPPVKTGHLIPAGAKEYELLADVAEVEGKFRSYDPDTLVVKVRVEYEHADKEHKDEYDRQQKNYNEQIKNLQNRFNNLQNDYKQAMATRNPTDKNNRMNNFNNQMQTLTNDKRNADQQHKDALKSLGMVRDFIDYELVVAKDASIRKTWAPKMFDDKAKVRDMTKEERVKYKGPDPKMVGWIAKLETFEVNMLVKIKLKASVKEPEPEPEPVNSETPAPSTTTPPPAPNAGVPGKDDPAMSKRQEVKIEDRPVVKMVIAEHDPDAPAPAAPQTPGLKKY